MQLYELTGDPNKWKKQLGALLVIVGVLAVLSAKYSYRIDEVKAKLGSRVSCSAFATQDDAQKAYKEGKTYLDGHPSNGIACDSYFKKNK